MTSIPGASKFLNASTLANLKGMAAQSSSLLDGMAVSLLSVGRNNAVRGIGISPVARAMNEDFLNRASGNANGLFSATAGSDATLEGLQKQVLALRSKMSDEQLAPSLRQDDGGVAASGNGSVVDEEA